MRCRLVNAPRPVREMVVVLAEGTAGPGLGAERHQDGRLGLARGSRGGGRPADGQRVFHVKQTRPWGVRSHEARVETWSQKDCRSLAHRSAGCCAPRNAHLIAITSPPVVSRETASPRGVHDGAPGKRGLSRRVRWGIQKAILCALSSTVVPAVSVRHHRLQKSGLRREPCG